MSHSTVRYGDTGDDVRELQDRLEAAGHPVGGVDGKFGSKE
ncbi:MAG: peptidoglycan-binding domain-containing protein [Acidimicrobiales bacterium]